MSDRTSHDDSTVPTVHSGAERCDYCRSTLPPARNHNGLRRRFCPGNRCRSAWHEQERRRVLEHAREALSAALDAVNGLLRKR